MKKVTLTGILVSLVILFGIISFTSVEGKAEGKTYKIGDCGPAGGWIFYDKGEYSDGWQYLEAAPNDQSKGADKQQNDRRPRRTGATGTEIGTGKSNTKRIISAQGKGKYAAKICSEYRGGGKKDWFLPSKDELILMYQNLYLHGIGEFAEGDHDLYISSSEGNDGEEYDYCLTWSLWFYSGKITLSQGLLHVRAIRAF
ncbi:MAG TPA: hypothetical protein PKG60_04655 [Spirochaetota bacterium]|nr:hypothetical protein [Spirochaetota bacterium]HPS87679.1 hypothetical protein [Spirochaetota bacterium]